MRSNAKVYNNSEVMMLLEENPKLRFESELFGDYFEMYVEKVNIEEGEFNYIRVHSESCIDGMDGNVLVNSKWKLKEAPVEFEEVVKRNCLCRVEHELINKKYFWDDDLKYLGKYISFGMLLLILSRALEADDLREAIKNGKWYIKEQE